MVTTHTIAIDPETATQPSWALHVWGGSTATLIGIAAIVMSIPMWLDTPLIEGLGIKLIWSAIGFGLLSWGASSLNKYFRGERLNILDHQCAVCNHQWEEAGD